MFLGQNTPLKYIPTPRHRDPTWTDRLVPPGVQVGPMVPRYLQFIKNHFELAN